MEAFLTSAALVALAEIGDKTQLLSFVLAARLRKPWAIIAGIFVATLLNHALAGSVGAWVADIIPSSWLPWIIALVFVAFGIWTLKPDTLDDDEAPSEPHPAGVFVTTTIAFFVAEMGDKTQLATVALAARFDSLAWVVIGTTVGMMIANVPAVLVGEGLAKRLPLKKIRWIAAGVFVLTGLVTLAAAGSLGL
ncbi:TMEM165/GDT1 family protein [Zoogloea sp.]|uniref:TMEM165/GDT1 family protein n=1 Tax=Zoogloea sp. TaxID=49181 RepID=UPI001ACED4EF|nr:TMEM165/GDT1 family protein [Zoogloea sp.]MBN8281655.1 TMEM165/GDT1 family protein [Zoogloea sp.]